MARRYGIAEWYGQPFVELPPSRVHALVEVALGQSDAVPPCPFRRDGALCSKQGGVCSIRPYEGEPGGHLGNLVGRPAILCPTRFEEGELLVRWLADIVGFGAGEAQVAREVPFMVGSKTGKPAGKIDLVVAKTSDGGIAWHGLEIQAVYFSGWKMELEFSALADVEMEGLPFPSKIRRPDWRSSSAKRLMPQLQIKAPTLRRWGSKIAVAVDSEFFDAIGGPSPNPSRDLNDGDVIWMVPRLEEEGGRFRLVRWHWEVLTLEDSSDKLLAASTIRKDDFERTLRARLRPLD